MKKKEDAYLELFPQLTQQEFHLLCYIAYRGETNIYPKFKIEVRKLGVRSVI